MSVLFFTYGAAAAAPVFIMPHEKHRYYTGDGLKMKKRILWYRNQIDDLLKQGGEIDWNAVMEEHLQQIAFFQHERLIHLIVTVLFAALEFLAIGFFVVTDNLGFGMLAFSLLILLVPYIRHYYLLENEVQKMYGQYDKLLELCGKKG